MAALVSKVTDTFTSGVVLKASSMTNITTAVNGIIDTLDLAASENITYSKDITARHFFESSDERLKQNIENIEGIENIPLPKKFEWKDTGKTSYGFIAQDLEKLGYDELVSENQLTGMKTVNYDATLTLLVAKLMNRIEVLENEIKELKNNK